MIETFSSREILTYFLNHVTDFLNFSIYFLIAYLSNRTYVFLSIEFETASVYVYDFDYGYDYEIVYDRNYDFASASAFEIFSSFDFLLRSHHEKPILNRISFFF